MKNRGRGRHGQSSYSAHHHQTLRHILMRHSAKREFGYQTLVSRLAGHAEAKNSYVDAVDTLNWEDIRDVIKKGRWLGDEKLALLESYLKAEEPDLAKSLDQTEFIERIGEAFSDFYIPPVFKPGTWDNATLRARLKLHDAYALLTDHGTTKIGFTTFPKQADRYLILREVEGLPFLVSHEFSIASHENARRDGDNMTNLYCGFCLPAPDFVVIHSRGLKFRNFRIVILQRHDEKVFNASEIYIPKDGKRTLRAGKRRRSLIGPYEAIRLERESERFQFLADYLDKIGTKV